MKKSLNQNLLLTRLCTALLMFTVYTNIAQAEPRPDQQGPLSLTGNYTSEKGELVLSYQLDNRLMEDLGDDDRRLNTGEVLAGITEEGQYQAIPTEMLVDTHTLGLSYAPSDRLTWLISLPFVEKSVDYQISSIHSKHPDETFEVEADGIGDLKIFNLISLIKDSDRNLMLGLGLSFPTGSTTESDEILVLSGNDRAQLPYQMQTGSGTYDFIPSLTYIQFFPHRSWGAQLSAVTRFGNNQGYSLGNRSKLDSWHAWLINPELSLSTRLGVEQWDNVDGLDEESTIPASSKINGDLYLTIPGLDPHQYAGWQMDAAIGLNGVYGSGKHRLGLEIASPLKQRLEGPQMQNDLTLVFGYQKVF